MKPIKVFSYRLFQNNKRVEGIIKSFDKDEEDIMIVEIEGKEEKHVIHSFNICLKDLLQLDPYVLKINHDRKRERYLFELQKRYIEIRESYFLDPHSFAVTDEMYMIGQILHQYGIQKDKLPATVEKFLKYYNNQFEE